MKLKIEVHGFIAEHLEATAQAFGMTPGQLVTDMLLERESKGSIHVPKSDKPKAAKRKRRTKAELAAAGVVSKPRARKDANHAEQPDGA
jgi:hypothetical protein